MREEHFMSGPLKKTNSAYAMAKIAGVEMCHAYNTQFGTKYLCVMPPTCMDRVTALTLSHQPLDSLKATTCEREDAICLALGTLQASDSHSNMPAHGLPVQFTVKLSVMVLLAVPEVAVTVKLKVPGGVPWEPPPPEFPPPQPARDNAMRARPAASTRRARSAGLGRADLRSKSAKPKNATQTTVGGPNLGDHETGTLSPRAVVVTDTMAATGLVPVGVIELGLTEQAAAAGAPVQLSVMG